MNTYLGQKGYSILKNELSVEEQIKLREELNVGAYMPKSIVQQAKFPVYRESPQKMYIPRYYELKIMVNHLATKLQMAMILIYHLMVNCEIIK